MTNPPGQGRGNACPLFCERLRQADDDRRVLASIHVRGTLLRPVSAAGSGSGWGGALGGSVRHRMVWWWQNLDRTTCIRCMPPEGILRRRRLQSGTWTRLILSAPANHGGPGPGHSQWRIVQCAAHAHFRLAPAAQNFGPTGRCPTVWPPTRPSNPQWPICWADMMPNSSSLPDYPFLW